MNNDFFIDFLSEHQELKRKYLKENRPLGSQCNSFTTKWINENSNGIDSFVNQLLNSDFTYEDVRRLYVISPSLHELWFFNIHFWHLIKAILYGRLGFKAVLTSRKRGTSIEKMSSTFLLRRVILLENMLGSDKLLSAEPLELTNESFNLVAESVEKLQFNYDLFSLIRGIIDLSSLNSLIKDWKFYSPCVINEGPIFDTPKDDIFNIVVKAREFQDKKKYLRDNFDVTEYYFREELF